MSDSNLTGKTQSDLDKSGHKVGYDGKTIVNPWGHSTGYVYNPQSGKAEPKK